MSHRMNDIDTDDPLSDLYLSFEPLSLLREVSARGPEAPSILTRRHPSMPLGAQVHPLQDVASDMSVSDDTKGKRASLAGPSEPVSIPSTGNVRSQIDDPFAILDSPGSSSSRRLEVPAYEQQAAEVGVFLDADGIVEIPADERADVGKGKGRELPPTLPPLDFSQAEFAYGTSEWPSIPGPSSYGSGYTSIGDAGERSPSATSPIAQMAESSSVPTTPDTDALSQAPIMSRRRTLSSGSKQSRRSLSAPSLPKMKVKFAAGSKMASGALARKLLFKRSSPNSPSVSSEDFTRTPSASPTRTAESSSHSAPVSPDLSDLGYVGQGSCLIPWSRDIRSRSPLATPIVETGPVLGAFESQPIGRIARVGEPLALRTKGRSYSSPLPFTASVFDIVPLAPTDLFEPPPTVIPDYFDEWLPHELQLHILALLPGLHEAEQESHDRSEKWSAHKASHHRNKWVGAERGIKDLFKLSRVSKSWQRLVFDGQLWVKLDVHAFPKLHPNVLMRLVETAGGFVRALDLSHHPTLAPEVLMDITHHICVHPGPTGEVNTWLTTINLQGCPHVTTRALHHVLVRSPQLQRLCVRGLTAVTNTTCEVLAAYCPRLIALDMGRCLNLTGEGIRSVASKAVERSEHIPLKELRLSGLRRVTDEMMYALGRAAPHLEILDLSYAKDLHNSSIEAFVACSEVDVSKFDTVLLTSREAGRDQLDTNRHWRRVTRLRHLNLSACLMLTDYACSHLAYAVPKLELLELAAIGPDLHDDGLVRLLNTTPYIRKLDLEDATEVTDAVLDALTPSLPTPPPPPPPPSGSGSATPASTGGAPEPGHALEHLIISYANVESEALAELIRSCPRLRVLEADNTRLTGLVLREYVQRARERRWRDAKVVAVDCRSVGEHTVRELAADSTRPRMGWRAWQARKLQYLDGRDDEDLGVGQDECDPYRVVVKTFYSWQTVDQVRAAREKKRKSNTRRGLNASGGSHIEEDAGASSTPVRTRWWSPSGRRSGPATPTLDFNERGGDGCTIM